MKSNKSHKDAWKRSRESQWLWKGNGLGLGHPQLFSVCEVFVGFTFKDKAAASTRFGSGVVGPGMQDCDRLNHWQWNVLDSSDPV